MIYQELFQLNNFYSESIYFTPYRYSDCYSIIKIANNLYKQMLSVNPKIRKNQAKLKDHLKKVLCNLVIAFKQQKCVVISRRRIDYQSMLERYDIMMFILDFLIDKEYIGQKLGCFDFQIRKGYKTRIWAKQKLIDVFKNENLKASDIKNRQSFNQVLIRDDNKVNIEYEETQFISELRYRIGTINTEYAKHSFKLDEEQLYPRIQAIYNHSSLNMGGRLYNVSKQGINYQNISKDARSRIKIDDEETVEVDYSGLHVNMLYALQGIQYEGNPYSFWIDKQIDESMKEEAKKQAKKVMFTIFNCDNIARLKWSLRDYDFSVDWDNIIELAKQEHSRISKYFGSGIGITLQNLDSKMMLDILEECNALGIVALGIHDSVIIPKKHKDKVVQIMQSIYQEHMHFNINIK